MKDVLLAAKKKEEMEPFHELDNFMSGMDVATDDIWDIPSVETTSESDEDALKIGMLTEEEVDGILMNDSSMLDDILQSSVLNSSKPTKAAKRRKVRRKNNEANSTEKKERNRLAARRCRSKQKERIDVLEKDVETIEKENKLVLEEIRDLQRQLKELKHLLLDHECTMHPPLLEKAKIIDVIS